MADSKWFIRGVPDELIRQVTDTAKDRGQTVGRLVTDILREGLTNLPAVGQTVATQPTTALLDDVLSRLTAVERVVADIQRFAPDGIDTLSATVSDLSARLSRLETERTSPAPEPRAERQMDIEEAIRAADEPEAASPDPTPSAGMTKEDRKAEQKADWKAFAAEIRSAPLAQGKGLKEFGAFIIEKTGIPEATVRNILNGVVASAPARRNTIREAVGLEPKE